MAARTYVNDAGTWRRLRNIYVNDVGTWRTIRKAYVNDAGTWRTVFQRGEDYQISAGSLSSTRGYNLAAGLGTILTPVGGILSTNNTINAIQDNVSTSRFVLALEGFGANPGQSFITEIEANGTSFLASGALSYGYQASSGSDGSGLATWTWTGVAGFVNGVTYNGFIALA